MSGLGAIDTAARDLFIKFGPTNRPPALHMFRSAQSAEAWHAQLAGQTRLTITAEEALTVVRDAWANVAGIPEIP